MALGAIGEDDERIREIEKMREFERMKGSGSEEKKKDIMIIGCKNDKKVC